MTEPTPVLSEPHDGGSQRPSRRGAVKVVVAAVVALALVVGGAVAAVLAFSDDSHKIVTPGTAAGMKRDTAREKQLRTQLDLAEQQFQTQLDNVQYVRSAVYSQDDTKRGPAGPLVFLGARLTEEHVPENWIDDFSQKARAAGFRVSDHSVDDGSASCAEKSAQGQQVAVCRWATKDSVGELVPTVAGYDSASLSKIMTDLREDVEQS